MNIRELEVEAKASATNHIINMLQRPGQLEKIERYKRTLARKKASVEALLKSAMQNQMDGVKQGLHQLKICMPEIKEIEQNLKTMNSNFATVPALLNTLNEVKEENMRYSQYVTAKENLKHIFTIPESVEKTKQWINEGKLLHTHQCLRDLENSRDNVLFELHKLSDQSHHDKVMLKAYFGDIEMISDLLMKQLRLNLGRTLNIVRKEPTVIVTTLRIIEREEKADEEALKLEKQTGFLSPGRPKQWEAMAFDILEKAVATRIEGNQVEEREDNKLWLVQYLERTRLLILEDLQVVKSLCVLCFPPKYNIVSSYINMYHTCLSKHLQEIIQNGLDGNEYVSVLSWVLKTYNSEELMGRDYLKDETKNLKPLLPSKVMKEVQEEFLSNMEKNYTEWMQKSVISEKQDWYSHNQPEKSGIDNYLRTATPVIIFEMIDQNLQVTKTISTEVTHKALILSIDQLLKYAQRYKESVLDFKNKHFEDRSQVPFFTQHMIATVNNCVQMIEFGKVYKEQYLTNERYHALAHSFQKLEETYINLRNESVGYLLEEVFLDLEKHFDELFTVRWLQATIPVDTVCATLEDYFQDYSQLVPENFVFTIEQAQELVVKRYVTSMLSKRTSFKTFEECQAAAKKILKEASQLRKIFSIVEMKNDLLDIIFTLSEIVKCEGDMLSLDLHGIVEKYSDITEDHLIRLLYLRGDLPKSDLREKAVFAVKTRKSGTVQHATIFKQLVFQDRMINW